MKEIRIVRQPLTRAELQPYLLDDRLVKAVIDCHARIMAIGGEMHSDEEALLLDQGSAQANLWGINLYPDKHSDDWIEFDSMINLRPFHGNRSRGIGDPLIRTKIISIVAELVKDA
ncbi:MAG: DUF5674 family protein [Planctomycetota bacterium]